MAAELDPALQLALNRQAQDIHKSLEDALKVHAADVNRTLDQYDRRFTERLATVEVMAIRTATNTEEVFRRLEHGSGVMAGLSTRVQDMEVLLGRLKKLEDFEDTLRHYDPDVCAQHSQDIRDLRDAMWWAKGRNAIWLLVGTSVMTALLAFGFMLLAKVIEHQYISPAVGG